LKNEFSERKSTAFCASFDVGDIDLSSYDLIVDFLTAREF